LEQITGQHTARVQTDFISKMGTVLEEPTNAFIGLISYSAAGKVEPARYKPLLQEADELFAIAIASIKTAAPQLEHG